MTSADDRGREAEPRPAEANAVRPAAPTGGGERIAGLPRRLGAMLYDALLILALWLFTLFPMVAISNDYVYGATVRSVLFLELYGFFAWFWIARGQTLGMLAWRLAIRTNDGRPMTLTQATLRFFAGMLSFATLGLGHLWMYADRERRTWPDMASGTHVVHLPKFK